MEDEIPPFAPPSGALLPPVQPTPAPQSTPAYPPQTTSSPYGPPPQLAALVPAAPSYAPLPPPPPRRRLPRNSVIGIVAGSAAILVIVGGAFGASALVLHAMGPASAAHSSGGSSSPHSSGPSAPHPGGVTSSAVASQPLRCTKTCFANDSLVPADTVPPPDSITALGLTKTVDSLGDYSSSTASDEYDQTLTGWNDAKAAPSQCFFTYFQSPVVTALGSRPDRDITEIDYSGTHTDTAKNNTLTQSVRIFANSSDAEAHMRQLSASVSECRQYHTSDSGDRVDVDVRATEAFTDFPSSEGAVGWTETSVGGRYESIDVQRGNLVVRTSLQSVGPGVTEEEFRSFVDDDAWQIASMLTPGDGH